MVYWWWHHQHSSLVASANMLSRSSDLESKFFHCLRPICFAWSREMLTKPVLTVFYVLQMDHNTSSTANCILTGTSCGDACRHSESHFLPLMFCDRLIQHPHLQAQQCPQTLRFKQSKFYGKSPPLFFQYHISVMNSTNDVS